tara:strand:+ start:354 stop:677 length:324 start_codon:yes stop_codon:yes gene_type:complete
MLNNNINLLLNHWKTFVLTMSFLTSIIDLLGGQKPMSKSLTKKVMHPIFKLYAVDYLTRELEYSEEYLVHLKHNRRPIPDKFKRFASSVLHRPEEELFNEEITNGTG